MKLKVNQEGFWQARKREDLCSRVAHQNCPAFFFFFHSTNLFLLLMQNFSANSSVNLPFINPSLSAEKLSSTDHSLLTTETNTVRWEGEPDASPLPGWAEAGRKSGFLWAEKKPGLGQCCTQWWGSPWTSPLAQSTAPSKPLPSAQARETEVEQMGNWELIHKPSKAPVMGRGRAEER